MLVDHNRVPVALIDVTVGVERPLTVRYDYGDVRTLHISQLGGTLRGFDEVADAMVRVMRGVSQGDDSGEPTGRVISSGLHGV